MDIRKCLKCQVDYCGDSEVDFYWWYVSPAHSICCWVLAPCSAVHVPCFLEFSKQKLVLMTKSSFDVNFCFCLSKAIACARPGACKPKSVSWLFSWHSVRCMYTHQTIWSTLPFCLLKSVNKCVHIFGYHKVAFLVHPIPTSIVFLLSFIPSTTFSS